MDARAFGEVFDAGFFRNRRVLVDERLPQNCDFFLVELIRHCGYSIYHFNNDTSHFLSLLDRVNIPAHVGSVYDGSEAAADILDDVWTGKKIFDRHGAAAVGVYRSSTAETVDYYDFDVVVRIEPLQSGCSSKVTGSIVVFARDVVHYDVRYKIQNDRTLYLS